MRAHWQKCLSKTKQNKQHTKICHRRFGFYHLAWIYVKDSSVCIAFPVHSHSEHFLNPRMSRILWVILIIPKYYDNCRDLGITCNPYKCFNVTYYNRCSHWWGIWGQVLKHRMSLLLLNKQGRCQWKIHSWTSDGEFCLCSRQVILKGDMTIVLKYYSYYTD